MKYAFASVLAILGAFAAGSALAASPAKLAELNQPIEQVFDTPGYDKAQIYDAAKVWIAENFRSAKAVMEYDNKEEGTLIGNGLIPYPSKVHSIALQNQTGKSALLCAWIRRMDGFG